VVRAYDAACWRFGRGLDYLNFPEVQSWEEAEFLVPLPNLQTRQDQACHERAQLKVNVAEADECHMAEWL
jgi:hypothetical protein